MSAFQRVLRAPSVREAMSHIPDVFYERFATVVLLYWLAAPLLLWAIEQPTGISIGMLASIDLQVGVAALALGALLMIDRLLGRGLTFDRSFLRTCAALTTALIDMNADDTVPAGFTIAAEAFVDAGQAAVCPTGADAYPRAVLVTVVVDDSAGGTSTVSTRVTVGAAS